jgi:CBS domain-containing protein
VVKLMSRNGLSMVAVLDPELHYLGAITVADIIKHYSDTGIFEDAHGVIVLEMSPKNYSMAEVASIIESENGKILSAYITPDPETESIDLTIKINLTDLSRIIASFERHEYHVKEHYHHTEFKDDLKSLYETSS